MNPKHELKLELVFSKPAEPETIVKALKPDMKQKYSRSKTIIRVDNKKLKIIIKSVDLTALRASFNSMLKSIIVSNDLIQWR